MNILEKFVKFSTKNRKKKAQQKARNLRQARKDDRNAMVIPFALGITGVLCAGVTYVVENWSKK